MLISILESQWLRLLVMHYNPHVMFANYKQIIQHAIPSLVVKAMEQYVMLALDLSVIPTIYFNLWMSKFKHDKFALMINFNNYHPTIRIVLHLPSFVNLKKCPQLHIGLL
jgi:hypothetical protein